MSIQGESQLLIVESGQLYYGTSITVQKLSLVGPKNKKQPWISFLINSLFLQTNLVEVIQYLNRFDLDEFDK